MCNNILKRPVEITPCSSLICCKCLLHHIDTSQDIICPCCLDHDLVDPSTIKEPTPYFLSILGSLKVVCDRCNTDENQRDYHSHKCGSSSTETLAIGDILTKSSDAPLTALEKELQSHLLKRELAQGAQGIHIKTTLLVRFVHVPFHTRNKLIITQKNILSLKTLTSSWQPSKTLHHSSQTHW